MAALNRGLSRLSHLSRILCPGASTSVPNSALGLRCNSLRPVSPLLLAQPVRQFAEEAKASEVDVRKSNEGQVPRGRRRHTAPHRSFWDDFENFFNDPFFRGFERPLFGRGRPSELAPFEGVWSPSVDISETKEAYVVHAELPGLKKEDVTIKIDDNVLTIQGERKFESEKKDEKNYYRIERSYGSFIRSFQLPEDVDPEHVKASFNNGVLEIAIPKTEAKPKGRTVTISDATETTTSS